MYRARGWLVGGLCLGAVLLLSGCASYSQRFDAIEAQLAAGNLPGALQALEKDRGNGQRDEVLYLLNRAILLRMQGDYRQSNQALEQAKQLIDELDAVSLREQAASLTVNDTLKSYIGSDVERALLYVYAALNYLQLDMPDKARVEILQLDVLLNLQADGQGSAYTEDAFARYLSGLVFEQLGEWSDAMIAYRKSYQNYQKYRKYLGVKPPHSLGLALLRMAEHLGLKEERRQYRKAFAIEQWTPLPAFQAKGEVVLIVGTGLASRKREESMSILAPEAGVMVRIALPRYEMKIQPVSEVRLLMGSETMDAELVEDIDAIAVKTLQEQMPAITARTLARAVVKYRAAKEVGDRDRDQGLSLLLNVAGMLSERADTRSWSTLPQRIYLARQSLVLGRHDISVQLLGQGGHVLAQKQFTGVAVEAGKKVYLSWRWIPSYTRGGKR
ncbi:hypothetical protein MNBD_GAMMA20-327 [hydrothermal vent metagenome]|uniref:Lipoprotein n=1 Tax=hydrothermal vent metagenome TaxID=652676 RepID=A0A3B1ABJ1_9ZZZZ